MNAKKLPFLILFASIVFFGSCEKAEVSDPPVEREVPESKIQSDNPNLSSEDAASVAKNFYSRNIATRADIQPDVKSIVTIPDASGQPAIYAVNLQDGYLLVSATKAYYPILAQVDHGTFSFDDKTTGQHLVIQDMLEDIKAAKDSVVNLNCKPAWFPYEKRNTLKKVATRGTREDFYAEQDKWFQKWYDEGYETYYLFRQPDNMPDDMYRSFCTTAAGVDPWEGTEYNCMQAAIITEKTFDLSTKKGPYLQSQWAQGYPYNSSVSGSKKLGCVTVAVGQIMRYYQRPASNNWSDMPYTTSSATLSSFLSKLRGELKIDNDGSGNIDDAKDVLTKYGYTCSKDPYNGAAVNTALIENRLVYLRGEDKSSGKGHAWVADGVSNSRYYTEYSLYVLNDCAYPDFQYIKIDTRQIYHNQLQSYHYNWGWYGDCDGWFLDSSIGVDLGEEGYRNYSTNRKQIIIRTY